MRKIQLLALLCAVSAAMAGCASKHIVRAAPPSVSSPPPDETAPMPPPEAPPPVTTTEEPAPEVPSPAPPPAPAKRPAAPRRPAPTETADPTPAKPAPPQISPQLSARDLEATKKNTTDEHYDRGAESAACQWKAAQRRAKRPDGKNKRIPQPGSRGHHGRRLGARAEPRRKGARAFRGTREIVLSSAGISLRVSDTDCRHENPQAEARATGTSFQPHC